jgi:photosystem II stability/assembly factor-like uncharacterized protein
VANGFQISSQIRTAPDPVSADLMTKLSKVDHLDGLDCPFGLRARFADCGEREDPANYNPIMLSYCDVRLQEHSYEDLAITDQANQDEILVTAPWQATYEMRIKKLTPAREGTAATLGDQAINDIEYCDAKQCVSDCGTVSDGCSKWFGVTDADAAPYAAPNLVKGTKTSGVITWSTIPILGINGNVEGIECAGSRIIVSSNADSSIAYNDDANQDQDEWQVVAIANAPSAFHTALYARTASEIWLAANSGFIYKSTDGGATWGAVHQATETTENLNAVWAHDKDLVYAVGDNGVILRSKNGGETWAEITQTGVTSANLIVVVVPPDRPGEVYIGTNDGQIFRSTAEGASLVAVSFPGDGVGTVDDISFCGPCGSNVMFILHNDAGPRARIFRDLSGGAGGRDVELVMDQTQVIGGGIDLNALACCNQNEVVAAGELNGGYPVIILSN